MVGAVFLVVLTFFGTKVYFRLSISVLCVLLFYLGMARSGRQEEKFSQARILAQEQEKLSLRGKIVKKEIKNEQVIYHLKNSEHHYLVYLNSDDYSIGTTITVRGKIAAFQTAVNEGNFDEESYYRSKNVSLRLREAKVLSYQEGKDYFREDLYQIRKKVTAVYESALPMEEAGVLAVMALGEKDLLDTQIKKLYQQSGISHVLAISGLHISLIGMGSQSILKRLGVGTRLSCLLAALLVYSFGVLSGMEVSAQRAVFMFLILSSGRSFRLNYDGVTALSATMFFQLFGNPFLIQNVGFLFSHSAVFSVIVCYDLWNRFFYRESGTLKEVQKTDREGFIPKKVHMWMKKLSAYFKSALELNIWIQLVTLPLTLYFFFEFPVYGTFVNIILLPFMGFILLFALFGGVVGVFSPMLASAVLMPVSALLRFNHFICGLFLQLPGASFIVGRPAVWLLAGYYGLLACILWRMKKMAFRECQSRPGSGKTDLSRKMKWILTLLPITMLLTIILFPKPSEFSIHFLDVGQGDGIYLSSEGGKHFFIDGGSSNVSKVGEYRILPFLKSRGIRSIDAWFVSHTDADHISGLQEILESGYPIRTLVLSKYLMEDEASRILIEQAKAHGTSIQYLSPGQCINTSDRSGSKYNLQFICLYPDSEREDKNANSMTLLVKQADFSAFFSGDIGIEQERKLAAQGILESVQLYKAAHHGSKNSNSTEIMEGLSPKVSVISCSATNRYGHPAKDTVERMEDSGSLLYYTMKSGQLSFGYREGKMWVREFMK